MSLTISAKPAPAVSLNAWGLASFASRILQRLAEKRAERRATRELSRYPDSLLKDMGISRSDIPGAVRYGRPVTYDIDMGNNVR
jgi:uncharacterized protein YjiS (DUF1127 family)